MSDSTESLRRTISSGVQLQSVVRTMKALAASSIGQYERSVRALEDYNRTVQISLGACLRRREQPAIQMTSKKAARSDHIQAIIFGSDQGLVGQFNDVIAEHAIDALARWPGSSQLWSVGERVHARLADAGLPLTGSHAVPNSVNAIGPLVQQLQIETQAQAHAQPLQLWVFYNRPVSAAVYEPAAQRLLPLDAQWQKDMAAIAWPHRNLPEIIGNSNAMLQTLIREYLFISLFRASAQSLASENTSRLAAMQRADKNIDDLLEQLGARFNQLRQSGIDEELFDVISGFEALVGGR